MCGKAKLLIADDEPGILQLLRDYFEMQGYQVKDRGDLILARPGRGTMQAESRDEERVESPEAGTDWSHLAP